MAARDPYEPGALSLKSSSWVALFFGCILEPHPRCHSVCAGRAKRNEKASRFIPWGFFFALPLHNSQWTRAVNHPHRCRMTSRLNWASA